MDYQQILQNSLNEVQTEVSSSFRAINKKIANKTVNYDDVMKFGEKMGQAMAKANATIIPEELTEYAESYLAQFYESCQKAMISVSTRTAEILNLEEGLNIATANVPTDKSRINHIVERFKTAERFDDVSFLTKVGVTENITKSAVADTIKENADLRNRIGLKTYVTRDDGAGCCDWCRSKVGTYEVGKQPKDFWAVHKDCSCTFDYKSNTIHTKVKFITAGSRITKQTTVI